MHLRYNSISLFCIYLIFLITILSSCGNTVGKSVGEADDASLLLFSEMQDKILISHNQFNEIPANIPTERFGGSIWTPSTEDDPNYSPIVVEKYEYRGTEYTVSHGEIRRFLERCCGDTIHSLRGEDENGNKIFVWYTYENKAPIWFNLTPAAYGEKKESFTTDDAIDAAKEFLDYFINQESEDKIDLSKYTSVDAEISETGTAKVKLKRYVHGILVHSIDVSLTSECQVVEYMMSAPLIDENVLCQIPDFTREQYAELVRPLINEIYSSIHGESTVSDLRVNEKNKFELVYLHNAKCYAIEFIPEFTVTLADGTTETPYYLCSYPLYVAEESD